MTPQARRQRFRSLTKATHRVLWAKRVSASVRATGLACKHSCKHAGYVRVSRALRKQKARDRKRERQQLVHAAGCVFKDCASNWFRYDDIRLDPECRLTPGTHVPRSLRGIFGFAVAP